MTKSYFPFDAGAGANVAEDRWRKMASQWLRNGVIAAQLNQLEVFADSTGMQVKARSGQGWVQGHFFESDAEETLNIGLNGSGNARVDRVVLRLDTTANTVDLVVLQGTAGLGAPALTQTASLWEEPLAQVSVASGAATIAAGDVTDERSFTGAAATLKDFDQKSRTSDSSSSSTTWANVSTAIDIVLAAAEGDWIEVAASGSWSNEGTDGFLDVICVTSGTHFGAGGASGQGIVAWKGYSGQFNKVGGTMSRQLVAGDISGGRVTLRLRRRNNGAISKTLAGNADYPLVWSAKNLGQRP